MLKLLSRFQINADAWDACVVASSQRIIYGYSWYLDAVLPAPSWKWVGLVLADEAGQYQAIMPIPLRRKCIAGVGKWVVHQPFFCQFLGVFSRGEMPDLTPFFQLMTSQFRYGSLFCTRQPPGNLLNFGSMSSATTHTLNLDADYEFIYPHYTHDRKLNLRRALVGNWTMMESTDPEPLLTLFRENHADSIDGGVADWAYDLFRSLYAELSKRGLATLRYALREGSIDAGALFAEESNRIIYLFNAASEAGRQGNARTLLIDQMIQEKAGSRYAGKPMIFDFESPEKSSIRAFYQSFGAIEEPFWGMRWNRLNFVERMLQGIRSKLKQASITN